MGAEYNVGVCYFNGEGVEKDVAKAFEFFSKAAAQGDAQAEFAVGVCYEHGKGVEEDAAKAFEWYSKVAAQGHAQAENNMLRCLKSGTILAAKVFERYFKAAAQGNAQAECNVGWCYENGVGVDMDVDKAFEWYSKAVAHGYAKAEDNVFRCCKKTTTSGWKGWIWIAKAANNGNLNAQKICYQEYEAKGGSTWAGIAVKYILLAAQQGDEDSKKEFEKLTGMPYANWDSTYKSKIKNYVGEYSLPLSFVSTGDCTYQYYEIGDLRIYNGIFEYTSHAKTRTKNGQTIPRLTVNGHFKDDYRDGLWNIKYQNGSDEECDISVTYQNGILNGPLVYKKSSPEKNIQINVEYKDNIIVQFKRMDSTGYSEEAHMDDNGFFHGLYLAKDSKAIIKGNFIHGNSEDFSTKYLQTGEFVRNSVKEKRCFSRGMAETPWHSRYHFFYGLHGKFIKGIGLATYNIFILYNLIY